jgi:hypothetical protein
MMMAGLAAALAAVAPHAGFDPVREVTMVFVGIENWMSRAVNLNPRKEK